MPAVRRLARNSRQTSRPLIPGITQSRIANTGAFSSRSRPNAVAPSSVTVRSNSVDSNCVKSLRKSGSSSAIRIFTIAFLMRPSHCHILRLQLTSVSNIVRHAENFSTPACADEAIICKILVTRYAKPLDRMAKAIYSRKVFEGGGHEDHAFQLCFSSLRIERNRCGPTGKTRIWHAGIRYATFFHLDWDYRVSSCTI